jgi:hypothetical protein
LRLKNGLIPTDGSSIRPMSFEEVCRIFSAAVFNGSRFSLILSIDERKSAFHASGTNQI